MNQKKFSMVAALFVVFVLGFALGYFMVGSNLDTSVLQAEAERRAEEAKEKFEADSAFLDDYEVTPEKVGEFVEQNVGGYIYEEDGVIYVVEGAPEETE